MTDPRTLAELGRAARSQRAGVRAEIAHGRIDVADLLEGSADDNVEAIALEMPVATLVAAVPGIGQDAVERILNGRCGPSRRLRELTSRTRRAIADTLRKEQTP